MTRGKGLLKVLRNLKPGLCIVVLVLEAVLTARSIRFLRAKNEPAKYARAHTRNAEDTHANRDRRLLAIHRGAVAMAFAFHRSGSGSISDGSIYGYRWPRYFFKTNALML